VGREAKERLKEQLAGELVLLAPLILFAALLRMITPVTLSLLTFMLCKWAYDLAPERRFHFGKSRHCIMASYGVFLLIGVATAWTAHASRFMINQPMLSVLLAMAVTLLWANAGEWQHGYLSSLIEFDPDNCTEKELLSQRAFQTMSSSDQEAALEAFVLKWGGQELADSWGMEKQSAANRKSRLRKALKGLK
jgi:hypothetical protein